MFSIISYVLRINSKHSTISLGAIATGKNYKFQLLGITRGIFTMKSIKLSSGYDMPMVGLGTWQTKPEEVAYAVTTALHFGYRHFDTAFNYRNEEIVGNGLKKWFAEGGKREDVFVTSKLPHFGNRPSDVEKYVKMSLQNLGLDYIDMFLIHMPFAFVCDKTGLAPVINEDGSYELDLDTDPVSVWKEMEKQVKAGRIRSIGMSNFNEDQILDVYNNSEIKPSNVQVELHAYFQQKALREFCKKLNIAVTAYSPLGSPGSKEYFQSKYNYSPDQFPDLLRHPTVQKIANNHNKSTGQVLLRYSVQMGVIVIPKSTDYDRIKANIDILDFELTNDEIKEMEALNQEPEGRIFTFLFFKGVENHPQYPFKYLLREEKKVAAAK